MKLSKVFALAGAAIMLTGTAFALSSCDETGKAGNGANTYVMEAEYVDIENVSGAGISDAKSGYGMIFGNGTQAEKDKGWSSGYFVGYTYTTDFEMQFKFTADKAGTATIILRLGSELGDLSLSSDGFGVKLNGTEISYSNMFVQNSTSMLEMKFYDKTLTTTATLKQGENVITLNTKNNTYKAGLTGGPIIDCIKISTDAKLTYTEKTDNPSHRGGI